MTSFLARVSWWDVGALALVFLWAPILLLLAVLR